MTRPQSFSMSFLVDCPCMCSRTLMHSDSPEEGIVHDQEVSFQLLPENNKEDLVLDKGMNAVPYSLEVSGYDILSVVGHGYGGATIISAARHKPGNQLVAIRRTKLESKGVDLNEIQHEVLLTRQLCHENVLPYFCSFISDGELFVVTPYVAYGSARNLLCYPFQQGMPELVVAFILHDVLRALEYLHRRGIIHRSVKASHILISSKGQIYLGGLRYACDLLQDGKLLKTMHSFQPTVIRSLNWLSPEVLEQNLQGYGAKSDIYSIGITACELANGAVPFSQMPPTQMLLEKLRGPTPLLLDASTCHMIESTESSGEIECIPNYFKQRLYTECFHQLVDGCLLRHPDLRPNVAQLLQHGFFKQCRRPHVSLFDLLHQLVPAAADVDPVQLNKGISFPNVDTVSNKLEEIAIQDDYWNFD